jgi:8-oxo-dGTP pyrophosphatase MutT (NUDIX family)
MRRKTEPEYLGLIRPWKVGPSSTLVETPIFTVKRRYCASRTLPHKAGEFVYLETADWVNVIAIDDDENVLLIEQFRHGTCEVTLEIPGGTLDPDEDIIDAGMRELAEETGYGGSAVRHIGSVTPNPATQDNRCHTLLVTGIEKVGDQRTDDNEEIAVRLVPLSEISALIRGGVIHHSLVVAAFHHLDLLDPESDGRPSARL